MPHIPNTLWHRNLQDPNTSRIKTKTLWRSRCGTSKSALLIPWRKEQLGKWEETQLQKEVRYKRSKERQDNEWQKQLKNKVNDKTGEGRRWHCRRSVADNNEYTMQGRWQRKESNHGAADLRNILKEKEPGKLPLYSPTASAGRAAGQPLHCDFGGGQLGQQPWRAWPPLLLHYFKIKHYFKINVQ
jgi:hypothetical protein